jgi:hypothetical protein
MPSSSRRDPLQTLEITDFTPGIHSAGGTPTRLIPAPLGAAQLTNTYRCIGLKNGGLGPLPAIARAFDAPSNPDGGVPPVDGKYVAVGFKAIGFVFSTVLPFLEGDELHLDVQYTKPGSPNTTRMQWYRVRTFEIPVTSEAIAFAASTRTDKVGSSMVATRVILTGTVTPENNMIILAHSWRDGNPAQEHYWLFPDPVVPTTNVPFLEASPNAGGLLIGHQSRILSLQATAEAHGLNAASVSNELINYTDPPLTFAPHAQRTQLGAEHPFGYGSWGSISSGELILIKRYGGALLVSGDIFAPSVISLPGVASTLYATNEGTFSPIGLIYIGDNGLAVYAWNGNSSSELLSENIDMTNNPLGRQDPTEDFSVTGLNYWHDLWGPYVVFSNNYILDTRTRSWWRLEQPSIYNVGMMSKGKFSSLMYFIEGTWVMNATQQIATGRLSILAASYSWNSQPVPVSIGRDIETRRVDVLASAESGTTSTVTVTLTSMTGSTQAHTFHITPAGQPVRLTYPFAVTGTNIIVRIEADSGDTAIPAPIVYGITMHYYEDTTIPDAA